MALQSIRLLLPRAVVGLLFGLLCVLVAPKAWADAFAFRDDADGVTCRAFDIATLIVWPDGGAPWVDAAGVPGGAKAFDSQLIEPRTAPKLLRWNLTELAKAWALGNLPNDGLVMVATGKTPGGAQFHSRESEDIGARPSLRLRYADGASELLGAVADASLDCSTHSGLGALPTLDVGAGGKAVLRFDLGRLRKGKAADIQAAELILVRTPITPWATGPLSLFRLEAPWSQTLPPPPVGLAAAFRRDVGIDKHPAVYFADGFASGKLASGWTPAQLVRSRIIEADSLKAFQPLDGPALRATIPRDENLGLDLRYEFIAQGKPEPDELYFRYYLRIARDWLKNPDSGKLPGFGGTYGKAGWGGRGWDGQQGWSARGSYVKPVQPGHPAHGRLMLASYVYHSQSAGDYGDIWAWPGSSGAAFIEPDKWVCVEQFVRLNTPGQSDGILRAWVDGRPVFERRGLRLRDRAHIRVESVWMDVYAGGRAPAVTDMTLYIDRVVVASSYIGPSAP